MTLVLGDDVLDYEVTRKYTVEVSIMQGFDVVIPPPFQRS